MNEQNLYSEMLEIPVNTCSITYTESKKRRKRRPKADEVKELVLEKVNGEIEAEAAPASEEPVKDELPESTVTITNKKRRRFSVIGVQIAVICLLLGVIIFSNLYMEQTGISAFLNSVFAGEQTVKEDKREYNKFAAVLPIDGAVSVENGVMCFANKGSVYAPCDGTVTAISSENGKYTVEVTHSTKFKTVIKGIDFAYQELGSAVYGNVPLGYSLGENVELCFYAGETLITEYSVDGDSIVWAV